MNYYNEDNYFAHTVLESFFNSDVWEQIMKEAENDDEDSIDLMTQISDQLASLTWHLQNDSNSERIQYEVKYFKELCEDFGIESI